MAKRSNKRATTKSKPQAVKKTPAKKTAKKSTSTPATPSPTVTSVESFGDKVRAMFKKWLEAIKAEWEKLRSGK